MVTDKHSDPSNLLATKVADSADRAIEATQRVANEALDNLAEAVHDVRRHVAPLSHRVTEQATAIVQGGMDSVREASQQVRDRAQHATDSAVGYIKDEPVKAMLIAAATGAALMALISLMSHSRHRE